MEPLHSDLLIHAPRRVVWDALADLETVVHWNPGIDAVERLGSRKSGLGARRRCFMHPGGWITESVIVWEAGELISFGVDDAPPLKNGTATFWLSDSGSATRLEAGFRYEIRLGPLGPVIDRLIVHRQLSAGWHKAMEGLREYAESVAAGLR